MPLYSLDQHRPPTMKRPWDSRKLLRIVEIPRVDGVRACDEVVEYDYKIN